MCRIFWKHKKREWQSLGEKGGKTLKSRPQIFLESLPFEWGYSDNKGLNLNLQR
jgi:hypothetical protein